MIGDHRKTLEGPLRSRRGVLLLVVLSMLSLFMMLGIAYVVVASRARDASRGFARVIAPSPGSLVPVQHLMDSAAMLIIRGNSGGAAPDRLLPGGLPFKFESLLEDQYGSKVLTGQVQSFQDKLPLCSVTVSVNGPPGGSPPPKSPVELTGRIVTFLPSTGKATSCRILRAEAGAGGSYRLWIAMTGDTFSKVQPQSGQQAASSPYNFPTVGTKIVINGRQHAGSSPANEAWDGCDFGQNPFLAQVEPVPVTPSTSLVVRASMFDASGVAIAAAGDVDADLIPDQCDNDNDGVIDGQFFNPGFPALTTANGNTIVTHMSCLIVDLDGRLNANAHGTIAQEIYPGTHNGWPTVAPPSAPTGVTWAQMPLGSGYGPADVSGAAAINAFNSARPVTGNDSPWMSLFLGAQPPVQYGAQSGLNRGPDQGCRLLPPTLPALEGRYAGQARAAAPPANATMAVQVALPGINYDNDLLSQDNERQYAGVDPRRIDFHGRMKSFATAATFPASVPTLSFAKPDSSDEFTDDPYEVNLTQAQRGGMQADPMTMGLSVGGVPDNTFSIAELERVLRPYDADSISLPQRLFALLGSQAEIGRLAFTTESWDVPVIAGAAADTLYGPAGWLASVVPTDLFSQKGPTTQALNIIPDGIVPADIAAGLRLDVTRPVTTDLQRRALFKDLFLVCVSLQTPAGSDPTPTDAEKYAQWAANAVEYQDADSAMTQYEYDPQPFTSGWGVDGDPATTNEPTRAVVWGAERPEIVITQTLAWENGPNGELYVMLHRPWDSRLEIAAAPPESAEPAHSDLRRPLPAPKDSIDLTKVTPAKDPVWQLRIGSAAGAPILRFDQLPAGSPDFGSTVAPPQFLSEFRANSWLCVRPSAPSSESVVVPPGMQNVFNVTNGTLKAPPGTTVVRLERLADPTKDHNATSNPYLIVDAADLTVVPRAAIPPLPHVVRTRDNGWEQKFDSVPGPPLLSMAWSGNPAWLMWPNRPLVSIVELMHIPGFATTGFPFTPQPATTAQRPDEGMLKKYTAPSALTYLPSPLLLETLRVPSRFAGSRLTIPVTGGNKAFLDNLENIGIYSSIVAVNQLDLAREPGRINLNTISSDAVWNAVVRGPLPPASPNSPIPSRSAAKLTAIQAGGGQGSTGPTPGGQGSPAQPAETFLDVLAVKSGAGATAPLEDLPADISDANENPLHRMYTATRLANTATNRSHLFAVWITLRTVEETPPPAVRDPDSVQYHRMFFIYDRSKPVAFEPGKDHNVRDGFLVKRVLP